MKQTKRAILEVSRAPQAPLLICSKMLQCYNNIEIKFDLLILSRILAHVEIFWEWARISNSPIIKNNTHNSTLILPLPLYIPMYDCNAHICPSACHLS